MTRIKMCGMRRACDIEAVNTLLPDYIGFIFASDRRRYIPPEEAAVLKQLLDPQITAVGVFVNAPVEEVTALYQAGLFEIIQLHGQEDEKYIAELRRLTASEGKAPQIWKAFRITSAEDIRRADSCSADRVLLDTGAGGTGKTFDWKLIRDMTKPFFLAGGLSVSNVAQAIAEIGPYGVDVSSGIESDGYKDEKKMRDFSAAVKEADGKAGRGR